jgi:hypothetical protein
MLLKSFKSLILLVFGLMVFSAAVYPQKMQVRKSSVDNPVIAEKNYTDKQFDNFLANLAVAIQAENDGLRKSAVYLAGLYSLYEVVPVLVNQLEKENNADIKILIALVLYKMEDPAGMQAVEKLYSNSKDARVKRMAKAILNEYENNLITSKFTER